MSHAKFPPSAAHRWLECPASISRSAIYPPTTSEAADEGTRLHDIAAKALKSGTGYYDPKVRTYVELVRETHLRFGGEMLVEHEVTVVKGVCYGTLDGGVVAPNFLNVVDYKSGTNPVMAVGNPQLMLYALGVLREYPMPKTSVVTLSIVQPNTKAGWPVKRYTPTVKTLLDFRGKVMAAIDKALAPNPAAVPGDHCYYCPAKRHCPEYRVDLGARRALL